MRIIQSLLFKGFILKLSQYTWDQFSADKPILLLLGARSTDVIESSRDNHDQTVPR